MRIVFLTQWFDPEPGAMRGLPFARWLTERGHEVQVITGFPNYPGGKLYSGYNVKLWQRETMDGVPVLRVPLYPNHGDSAIGRVANYTSFAVSAASLGVALGGPADVCYVYHPPASVGLAGVMMKAFRRTPIVYHIADMWPESVVESGMLGRGVVRRVLETSIAAWCSWMYGIADLVTVLSPGFKKMLIDRGVPAAKVEVVFNWTQEDIFRPIPVDKTLARELDLEGTFNIVYAGNLGTFPALDTVIRVAARVKDLPDLRVVLAGTGQKESELRELAREVGANNVHFLGYRQFAEMPRINSLADVLLIHLRDLPFFSSTIPSKTQVALASGKPILMAVAGDAAEIVTRAEAGISCRPQNEAELESAIRRFYAMNPKERERLGANGRRFYMEQMSLAVGGARTEECFERVSSRTGRH